MFWFNECGRFVELLCALPGRQYLYVSVTPTLLNAALGCCPAKMADFPLLPPFLLPADLAWMGIRLPRRNIPLFILVTVPPKHQPNLCIEEIKEALLGLVESLQYVETNF